MKDIVVVDVETQYLFEEVGGRNNLDKLEVGLAVVYSYTDESYSFYKESSVQELRNRLYAAEEIIGYNSIKFDLPVIFAYKWNDWLESKDYKNFVLKSNDLLRRIWLSKGLDPLQFTGAHKGFSLKDVCLATLGLEKADLGKESPGLLRRGDWDIVAGYCQYDVFLTKKLKEFIDTYGYIINSKNEVVHIWAEANEKI